MDCAEIRQRVVEYYQQRGYQLLPRAPMLHPSIPISFVMSAGRTQNHKIVCLTEMPNRDSLESIIPNIFCEVPR